MKYEEAFAQFAGIHDETADTSILRIFGEVDIASAPEFERAVQSATMRGKAVEIDLSECGYIDSSGLAVIARAVKRYTVPIEALVRAGSNIARIMELTGFEKVLPICFTGNTAKEAS